MDSFGAGVIGFFIGAIIAIVAMALIRKSVSSGNICPRCEEELKEESALKKEWSDQESGYSE